MTQYDEYFTNDDKPFAENLNDVLLVSNVFDYAIDIEMPKMFTNGNFTDTTSSRKCGVSIISLVENSGLTINSDNITGTGTLSFKFYPNFNSFDGITKVDWDCTGTISCKIKNINGTLITNVTKGQNINNSNLKPLKEYLIELTFSGATLNKFFIKMTNKSSENRYGANVKVQSVDGLEDRLNSIENDTRWEDARNPKDNQIIADEDNRIDLNDIIDTGFYYAFNNNIISFIDNVPNDLNGRSFYLEVQKRGNDDVKQLLTRYSDSERWIRIKYNGNWNNWIGLGKKVHSHGDITNDGIINTNVVTKDVDDYPIVADNDDDKKLKRGYIYTGFVWDNYAHNNIGSSSQDTQTVINDKIDGKLGEKLDKVQGSANNIVITDGNKNITIKEKLGNINVDGKIGTVSGKIITTDSGGVLIASDSITKSKISDFPLTMTPSSHSHGNITNDGKLGSSANKPLITGTGGLIGVGSFGTSANTFCQGNDSRLSNTRNPTVTLVNTNAESQIDLNDYNTQAGFYYFYNSTTINRVGNIPSDLGNNAFYLIVERYNNSYVKQTLTRYNDGKIWVRIKNNTNWNAWQELSVVGHTHTKSNITDFSHSHGDLTNDGKIGSTSGYIVTTGTGGKLQAVSSITKSKISDFPSTMTPSAHTDSSGNYGKATTSVFGHTKLSSATNSTAEDVSATPKAVKSAYDLANTHIHGNLNNNGTLSSDTDSVNKVVVTNSSNQLKTIQKIPFGNLNISKSNITGLGIPASNTTYSAGSGLSLSGTTFNHSNNVVGMGTLNLAKFTCDTEGHITGYSLVGIDSTSGGTSGSSSLITSGAVNDSLTWKPIPNFSVSNITAKYNKNFIVLEMNKLNKKLTTGYTTVGTLPVGYRPNVFIFKTMYCNGAVVNCVINSSGEIRLQADTGGTYDVYGQIMFARI